MGLDSELSLKKLKFSAEDQVALFDLQLRPQCQVVFMLDNTVCDAGRWLKIFLFY